MKNLRLIACSAGSSLADRISAKNSMPLNGLDLRRFSDGEIFVEIKESVRGKDVYIVQSTSSPVNDNLMALLITIDACKRASASSINLIIPYFGYARQDRKVSPRTPITARLVADLLETAGATRVLSVDLHSGQIQGFFDIPFDNIYGAPILLEALKQELLGTKDLVVVSPDAGGVNRARMFASRLEASLAIIDKRRYAPNKAKVMNIIGDVKNKVALIVDDMIDTAGTLCNAAEALKEHGATDVIAVATHGVLSGPAIERIEKSNISKILITDTIPPEKDVLEASKIKVVPIDSLLAMAISKIQTQDSLSVLFV